MTYLLNLLAALLVLIASADIASADTTVEPAEPMILPLAIVCVERPGTSTFRPCQPWCEERIASHVLRLMRVEQGDGSPPAYEWREAHCLDYLDERRES